MSRSKQRFYFFVFGLFATLLVTKVAIADDNPGYRQDVILVKVKPEYVNSFSVNGFDKFGSKIIKEFRSVPYLFEIEIPLDTPVETAINWYIEQEEIVYAEPDYAASTMNVVEDNVKPFDHVDVKTLDPLFLQQWALLNVGQSGGTIDADINAVESWLIEIGTKAPVIGIIDSGVEYTHSDLNGNLWQNLEEIPANAIDDDLNGYVDDIYGINALTGSGNPLDDFHHGTRVAGIIGAVADNSIGISGVMNVANMASCKFLNNTGNGNLTDAIECIDYFVDLKTRFFSPENIVAINNSWILNAKSQSLQDAIATLRSLDIVFVAAAGNTGTNNDVVPSYPANYPVSNVISVAATERNDIKPSYSNYGKATVHVAAPGSSIVSTVLANNYGTSSGTSLAAPHVTGLIGLLASNDPSLTWWERKNLAIAGGQVLAGLGANTLSSRRIRGADLLGVGSLTCANQVVQGRMEPLDTNIIVATNSPVMLRALHIDCANPNGNVTVYDDGVTVVTLEDGGINGDDYAGDGVYSLNWIPTIAGDYAIDYGNGDVVNVRVYDPSTWHNYDVAVDAVFTSESIVGTSLGGGNETVATLTSPFPILLGGDATGFTTLYISSNGAISVSDRTVAPPVNTNFPNANRSTLIAPFWDDLTFTLAGAAIYYQVVGSAPNRKLVVEWRNFKHFIPPNTGTFQVIFYEGSSNIRMAYIDTDLGSATYNSGRSATVGIQLSPTLYNRYSYLMPKVPGNRSLLYTLVP